jgi:hypothetical protein
VKIETRGRKSRSNGVSDRKLSFAVDASEDESIRTAAKRNGMTLSSYLRWMILGGEPMKTAKRKAS